MSQGEPESRTMAHGAVTGWVREAYPAGVPSDDLPALLGVLKGEVGSRQTMATVLELVAEGLVDVRAAAAASVEPEPSPLELRRVAGRLVVGGWPLASFGASTTDEDDGTEEGSYLGRIVAWLRDGYPQGVPAHDYVPLLALLQRRLTRGEVKRVARALRRSGVSPAGPDDIAAAISELTHDEASEADMIRVRDKLAAKGWPVEFPEP